jgi:proteasome accessory factor B
MSRVKTERLLNLVICLLAARRYVSKEEIRRAVPGYSDSPEAFERAFERDKDELREMGVPVETGSNDPWFEDEVGYRIRGDAYALPEVAFTAAEMSVLGLAARAWQQAALGGAATRGLLKLRAYGVDTDDPGIVGLEPRVDTNEVAFAPLWRAVTARYPVRFAYRRPGGESATRLVEPWGIVSWHGRWYLVGHDRDRAATRVFRLSRITGEVAAAGAPGEVSVPADVDVRREVSVLAGEREVQGTATIRVRRGAGAFLRRGAAAATEAGDGWDVLDVPFADADQLADTVVGLGAAAVVLEPAAVRDAAPERLRGALTGAAAGPAGPA